MFGVAVVTFLVTALGLTVIFLLRERGRLMRENSILQKQVNAFRLEERDRRERTAYDAGLYDGRQTDALYRQMLGQYQRGERVTVILNGEKKTDRGF